MAESLACLRGTQRFLRSSASAATGGFWLEPGLPRRGNLQRFAAYALGLVLLPALVSSRWGGEGGAAAALATVLGLAVLLAKAASYELHRFFDGAAPRRGSAAAAAVGPGGAEAASAPLDLGQVELGELVPGAAGSGAAAADPDKVAPTVALGPLQLRAGFSRPELELVLDRTDAVGEILLAACLAAACAAAAVRLAPLYSGGSLVLLWLSAGGGIMSLVKSAQPDPASPVPSNLKMGLSRATAFLLLAVPALLLGEGSCQGEAISGFGLLLQPSALCATVQSALATAVLLIPVFAVLGWMPSVQTFFSHALEQLTMHVFGGAGGASLAGGVLDFCANGVFWLGALACGWSHYHARGGHWLAQGGACGAAMFLSRLPCLGLAAASQPRLARRLRRDLGLACAFGVTWGGAAALLALLGDVAVGWCATVAGFGAVLLLVYSSNALLRIVGVDAKRRALFGLLALAAGCEALRRGWSSGHGSVRVMHVSAFALGVMGDYVATQLLAACPFGLFLLAANFSEVGGDQICGDVARLCRLYRGYVLTPLVVAAELQYAVAVHTPLGPGWDAVLYSVAAVKIVRLGLCQSPSQFAVVFCVYLFGSHEGAAFSEGFLADYAILSVVLSKAEEAWRKLDFVIVYLAPATPHWGSVTHFIIYLLWVPHFAFTMLQLLGSSILSAPLFPAGGSAVFLSSYVRPTRFFEKVVRTQSKDSQTITLQQMSQGSGMASNALDNVFYETLLESLRSAMPELLRTGAFGAVGTGDFVFLLGEERTALVHFISLTNGSVTFQLRGIEFQGTLCHEAEKQAINASTEIQPRQPTGLSEWLCCMLPAERRDALLRACPSVTVALPWLLPLRTALRVRWSTWRVCNPALNLKDAYSLAKFPAQPSFQTHDEKRRHLGVLSRCCMYELLRSPELRRFLETPELLEACLEMEDTHVDHDHVFAERHHDDFSRADSGISLRSFYDVYGPFIAECLAVRESDDEIADGIGVAAASEFNDILVKLCFRLTLLARRSMLGLASYIDTATYLTNMLSLMKGGITVSSAKDEWVLAEVELLDFIKLGARQSLAAQLDFSAYLLSDIDELFGWLEESDTVVTDEMDPLWRRSMKQRVPCLMSLRKTTNEESDNVEHFVVRMTLQDVKFKAVQVNREAVRGLWSAQQHELVFLRNPDPERGSIQSHPTSLRNLLNQSCDSPVGYPIFVSSVESVFE